MNFDIIKQSSKTLLLVTGLLLFSFDIYSEEVEFRGAAPSQVIAGQPFQLTYTINQRVRDFQNPDFSNFEYLAGPYTSQSSSTSFINGKRTSSFTLSYTFTLMGMQPGTFTIPPAVIKVDNTEYQSNGVRITVLPEDEPQSQSNPTQPTNNQRPTQQNGSNTSSSRSEDIFMRTIVSKTIVQEQEVLLLTYKLYFANVDVAQLTNNTKIPEFTGFLKQVIELGEIQTELEHYNGRNYQTATIYQTLLYPQHSGDIKIEPAHFEVVIRVQNRRPMRSIFDDFFGSYSTVTRGLNAPGVTIHVKDLPTGKPASFSGGVGHFSMTDKISTTNLQVNDAVTLKLEIKGTGNIKLIKTPSVDWPEGFEVYDPKITNNFKTTTSGVTGTKTIEYLAIPRAAGDYTIPAIAFSYFDVSTKEYKTIRTKEYTLHINRGAGDVDNGGTVQQYAQSGVHKEDIKMLGTDIRYIHSDDIVLQLGDNSSIIPTIGSLNFWLFYLIPLFGASVLFLVFRKRIRDNANQAKMRYKRANKVAQKRLKVASRLMKEKKVADYYSEIERAAFSYLSDRLSIPTANLSKDNIMAALQTKKIPQDIISEVKDVLQTAEFARYAPSENNAAMQDLYNRTVNVIDKLENQNI